MRSSVRQDETQNWDQIPYHPNKVYGPESLSGHFVLKVFKPKVLKLFIAGTVRASYLDVPKPLTKERLCKLGAYETTGAALRVVGMHCGSEGVLGPGGSDGSSGPLCRPYKSKQHVWWEASPSENCIAQAVFSLNEYHTATRSFRRYFGLTGAVTSSTSLYNVMRRLAR